jgi:glycosyltransferase involved in cell wall biosynthesis
MVDQFRVLFVCSHPVQYQSPIFREMAKHPRLDIQVAYCSLQGAEPALDPEFGIELSWDVPVLEGYSWINVLNRSRRADLQGFFGLVNPGLWKLISSEDYDAVVVLTGYVCVSFWIALLAAKLHRRAILFGTDAHALAARDGKGWKSSFKRLAWPRLFGLADVVIVPSTRGVEMMQSLGIPDERLALTPYAVDNAWWTMQSEVTDRDAVRRSWGVPQDAPVALFCAKLQPWKRPLDLLHAFASADVADSHLVYAGEGVMRSELEARAHELGLAERVHFLGFRNQSQLPAVYCASDLLVLPSEYEPFGVVVNEAMLCGCAAVVSDRVGAGHDLVSAGENGFIFPCGDRNALAAILCDALSDPNRLHRMGANARRRMETWSPRENIQGILRATELGSLFASRQ